VTGIVEQVAFPLVVLAVWFVVMRFILPRLGVST
jgi:hypothetical protein